MKAIDTNLFIKGLSVREMTELVEYLNTQMVEDVLPSVSHDQNVEYRHFVLLGYRKYLQVHANYKMLNEVVQRDILSVREYSSELEMEFYMCLYELENEMDPNPIRFN